MENEKIKTKKIKIDILTTEEECLTLKTKLRYYLQDLGIDLKLITFTIE